MRIIFIFILLVLNLLPTSAQVSVDASIDSLEMYIGEQVHVTLTVVANKDAVVDFPSFQPQQMLVPGVEVLNYADSKQPSAEDGMSIFSRVYTLTSFDGKLYYVPSFMVRVNNKEYKSKSLALKVIDVPVDTANVDKFFGPKTVQDNPFSWSDWEQPFWLSVLMLILVSIGYYLYVRLMTGKPIIAHVKIVKRLLPHQKAMKAIERIKEEKMVLSENPKEYYTYLTETLRRYIVERYGFNAMEMTSSEIITRLMSLADEKSLEELRKLFITADLVKFAKYSTLLNENDMNLVNAIEFINQTKLDKMPAEEIVHPQLSTDDVHTIKVRRILRIIVWLIAAVSFVILLYVVYMVYLLIL